MAFLPPIEKFSIEGCEARDKEVNSTLNYLYHMKIETEDNSYNNCNQTNTLVGLKIGLAAENIYKVPTESCEIVPNGVKKKHEHYETALKNIGDNNPTSQDSSSEYIDKQKTESSKLVLDSVKVEIKKEIEEYDTDFSNIGNINTSNPYSIYLGANIDRSNDVQNALQTIKTEVKQENEENCLALDRIKDRFTPQIHTEVKLEDFVNMERSYNLAKAKIRATKKKRKKLSKSVKKWIFWINLKKNKNKTLTCYSCGEICLTPSICMYHYKVYHCAKKVSPKKQTQRNAFSIVQELLENKRKQTDMATLILYTLLKTENNQVPTKGSSGTRYFIMTTRQKLYKCDICSKQFIQRDDLNLHQAVHSLECELCGKVCGTEDKLMEHHSIIHFGITPFKCHVCPRTFALAPSLTRHGQAHNEEKKSYKCTVCHKDFSSNFCLKLHKFVHTKEKPFNCEICLKKFKMKRYLEQHKFTHSSKKIFECKDCCKKYTFKCGLRQHLLIHKGEKRYKCHLCPKEFAVRSYYKNHLVVHSDKKPFQCEICPKNFTQKRSLQRHFLRHTGEKKFLCEICSRSFYDKMQLKEHIRFHEDKDPFKCEVCQKSLSSKSSLRGHTRMHSGEKPYECDICLRSFANQGNMKKHKIIHSKPDNLPKVRKKV